jgi:hypothetical protein
MVRVAFGSLLLVGILGTSAVADRPRLEVRVVPPVGGVPLAKHAPLTGHTLYLNRCIGGCSIMPGEDDGTGTTIRSQIADNAFTMPQANDLSEQEWTDIVQCIKEVYSPFAITVTDVKPAAGVSHATAIIGGNDDDGSNNLGNLLLLGAQGQGVGGIAASSGDCSPIPRGVSYTFADNGNVNSFALSTGGGSINPTSRAQAVCWIVAQETAHSFGLDHQFEYIEDKTSACNDPMSYPDGECGGQKFFRNRFAACGVPGGADGDQPGPRACRCGANQNSHLKLLSVFGEGASLIGPPTVNIVTPQPSTAANSLPGIINVEAGSKRGVNRVELFINGFKWADAPGARFGNQGQPNPGAYAITVPADVPNSIVDIQIKAYDDLEIVGESEIVTVTKGPAGGCTSADTCAEGQRCEAGKCFWDPPSGVVGDECTYPQFCLSGICQGTAELKICTQTCVVGLADACPMNLECIATSGASGICFPVEESGCCSTTNRKTPWAPFLFAGVVLGFIIFRRRR